MSTTQYLRLLLEASNGNIGEALSRSTCAAATRVLRGLTNNRHLGRTGATRWFMTPSGSAHALDGKNAKVPA